jgi:hypothetical protein
VGDSSYLQLQDNLFNLKYFGEDEDMQKMKDLESILNYKSNRKGLLTNSGTWRTWRS